MTSERDDVNPSRPEDDTLLRAAAGNGRRARSAFPSTAPAGPNDQRMAIAVAAVSAAAFIVAVPFSQWQLPYIPEFIPAKEPALAAAIFHWAAT